jgi:putative redox protein
MANKVNVKVDQIGPTASEATIRQHEVLIDRPEAKGGEDRGAMGGELLLASLGGCFMSTLLAAIRAREANVSDVHIDISGTLEESPARFSAIEMTVAAAYEDEELIRKLVTIAERSCIVANTLKDAVDLSVNVRAEVATIKLSRRR